MKISQKSDMNLPIDRGISFTTRRKGTIANEIVN